MATQVVSIDPLLCDVHLPLQAVYYPFGFPVQIATNEPGVLAGAEESWGNFRELFFEPPLQLRIGVQDRGPDVCPSIPVFRGQRNLVSLICDPQNFAVCDTRLGFAFCWVASSAVHCRAYFRYHFLEGIAGILLESLYLTSTHAACVSWGGKGVLLCGESGAGKSSLSFACARNGWTFTSDDSSCVVRKRKDPIVVGNPYQIRFRESAIELFPELVQQRVASRATGEMAIEVATETIPNIDINAECPIHYILFLNRGNSSPLQVLPLPRSKALQYFERAVCFGENHIRDDQSASLRNLLTAEVFEFRYSDLDSAVERLETLVRDGM